MSRSLPVDRLIPRDERHAVKLDGIAKLRDGSEVSLRVRNLSCSGSLLEMRGQLPAGEVFTLVLPNGEPLHAQVRWSFPGESGVSFFTSIWSNPAA